MNEKEKKAIEDLKGIDITYFVNGHECANFYLDEADKVSKEIELILNLIEKQQKELNNLKEIEKSHQEDNGKLKVELEQEKEKNKELGEKLKIAKQLYNDVCVCIATDCVEKDKIKDMMKYREFELQQEYKEFEEDVEWRTYKKILEGK